MQSHQALLVIPATIWGIVIATRFAVCSEFLGTQLAWTDTMKAARASWLLYLVGSLLVFGSWVEMVPTALGWIGWLMALVGWAVGDRPSRTEPMKDTPLSTVEQIEKLAHLRQRTVITEDEFQKEKRRLLDRPDAEAAPRG